MVEKKKERERETESKPGQCSKGIWDKRFISKVNKSKTFISNE